MENTLWDERYSAEHFIYGTEPNQFLANHFGAIGKGAMPSFWPGWAYAVAAVDASRVGLNKAARLGYAVAAVDASRVGLNKAARLARENAVEIELVCSDLCDYSIGHNRWDGIVSVFCHLPPDLRKPLHRKVVDGLTRDWGMAPAALHRQR